MPPTTMMGAVMGQGGAMMGQNTGMMVGMTMPNGFMGNAQPGVMGLAPGMMGPQGMVAPQNMYAMQPGQQGQWNMAQVCNGAVSNLLQIKCPYSHPVSVTALEKKKVQGVACTSENNMHQ